MPNRLQTRWVFTWNKGDDGFLPGAPALCSILNEIAAEAVFQLEVGENTRREHYQGRFKLKGGRKSKSFLLKKFSELGEITNLTFQPEIAYDSSSYCEKSETRVAGPWYAGLTSYTNSKKPMKLSLRKWQTQLLSLLTGEHTPYFTDRKVIWIQDTAGNAGKSTFIKHLAMNEKEYKLGIEKLPIDQPGRIRASVIKLAKKKDVDVYIFDFTRTQGEDTHYSNLFEVIEEIKNSYIVDVMYGNFNKAFLKPAMVIIFTNNRINDFKKYLSLDRWAAFSISKEDQSLNYLDLSNILASQEPEEIPFEQYLTDKLDYHSND